MYKQVWEMYKASERGKKAIDTYENVYKTKKYVDTESMFEPFAKYYIIGNDTIEKTKNNFRDDVWYANEIFEKHWGSINDNSVFTELKKIIGRYVVERMK